MAEQNNNEEELDFQPKRRSKRLIAKRAASDSEKDKNKKDISTVKRSNKRPAENNIDEKPCKGTCTEENTVCAICREPDSPEPFTFLICAHSFHTTCITSWLKRSRHCPLCRIVVQDSIARRHDKGTDTSARSWSESFTSTTTTPSSLTTIIID